MPYKFNPFTGTLDLVPTEQAALTFPLAASLGGTGIANGASATLTLPNVALTLAAAGAYTLTIPATGTAALLATANVFTALQQISSADGDFNDFISIKRGGTDWRIWVSNAYTTIASLRIGGAGEGYFWQGGWSGLPANTFNNPSGANGDPTVRILGVTNQAYPQLHVLESQTTNGEIREITRLETTISTASTGGAAGIGPSLSLWAETATNGTSKQQGRLWSKWVVPTNGSETSAVGLDAFYNSTAQEFISGQGDAGGVKLALYGGTRVTRGAALTTQLTTITFTAPTVADYALQDITNAVPYGFTDAEELRTFISVVKNLQTRCAELEARLGSATGINAFA